MSQFTDDIISYVGNLKNSRRSFYNLQTNAAKLKNTKSPHTNISYISIHLQWTIWKQINKIAPFTITHTQRIKKFGKSLTKKVNTLYTENYKMLLKEIFKRHKWMERHPSLIDWKKILLKYLQSQSSL